MDKKTLIKQIKEGAISEEAALKILEDKGYADVGENAKIDFSRRERRGFPEAIYCASKDDKSLIEIFKAFYERRESVIGTCLLYTSPSPRDGLLTRMPSSA